MTARIAVLMMQKNESGLLSTWVDFYSYVFNIKNLFIFDNGSDDLITLESLERVNRGGGTITYVPGIENFSQKGTLFLEKIYELRKKYDYFYLVDCDEFIVKFTALTEFEIVQNLCPEKIEQSAIYRIKHAIWNAYGTDNGYYCEMRKLIVCNDFIPSYLDFGLHLYDFNLDSNMLYLDNFFIDTQIGIIHYHNRPFLDSIARAKLKLQGRIPDFEKTTLENYQGNGIHLVREILNTEENYLNTHLKYASDYKISLKSVFRDKGIIFPY